MRVVLKRLGRISTVAKHSLFGIRAKLLASFIAVALFAAIVGAYSAISMSQLKASRETLYTDVFGGSQLLAHYIDLSWQARSMVLPYLLTEDPAQRPVQRQEMNALDAEIDGLARGIDAADTDRQEAAALADVNQAWANFVGWRDATLQTSDAGDRVTALAAYNSDGLPLTKALDDATDNFLTRKGEAAGRLELDALATYERNGQITLSLTVAAVGLAVLVGFISSRNIASAARQVADAARGIAAGNLDQRIRVRSNDELGQMAAAFRDMIASQQHMARVANAIARGDLSQDVEPKSKADSLGNAFQRMSGNLRTLVGQLELAAQRARDLAEVAVEREAGARAVLDSVADGIIIVDGQGAVESINPAAEIMFGYSSVDDVGRSVGSFLAGDLDQRARHEVTGLRKDGTVFPAEVAISWLKRDAQLLSILSVQDVTERKIAEQQVHQLARSDKLRALGQMASGIAHDLNQSLSLVAGYGELAGESLGRGGDLQVTHEYLRNIVQAALGGGDSVKRLLTFTRQQGEGPRERVDLGQVVHEIGQLTAPQWRDAAQAEGRPIDVRIEVNGPAIVEGWPHALREALTNLLFNAVDALPGGGEIRLAVRCQDQCVVVEVSDNGIGMLPEVQERIFEPFFTTKGERGTGLGLAQVYGIVQQHDGEISVDSAPGRGSTFRLAFAAAVPTSSAELVDAAEVQSEPSDHGLRILAVDDEPGLARMVALMLGKTGHQVEVTTSGEAALALLSAHAFDLVITDLGLGSGINGWQVAEQVRKRWPWVRVVLATGWGAAIDQSEAKAHGVEAVIAKPYSVESLRRLVGLIGEQVARAEPTPPWLSTRRG